MFNGSKSARSTPAEGLAFLISAMKRASGPVDEEPPRNPPMPAFSRLDVANPQRDSEGGRRQPQRDFCSTISAKMFMKAS